MSVREFEIEIPVTAVLRMTVHAENEDDALEMALEEYTIDFMDWSADEHSATVVADNGEVEHGDRSPGICRP